jgi:hypothetical protein
MEAEPMRASARTRRGGIDRTADLRSVETVGLGPGREAYAAIKSIAFDHHAHAITPAAPAPPTFFAQAT